MKRLAALLVTLVLILLTAPPATADSALIRSIPQAGTYVTTAPQFVRLMFDRTVGGAGPYRVKVTADSGEAWDMGSAGIDGKVVTVPLRKTPANGTYHVEYRVTPPGGTALAGSYSFTVDVPGPTPVWVWIVVAAALIAAILVAVRLSRR